MDRTRRHVWSPVLIDYTAVREAQEGKRREAGEWGNKLCRETNKCTVNERNNKMLHKRKLKGIAVYNVAKLIVSQTDIETLDIPHSLHSLVSMFLDNQSGDYHTV